MGPTATFLGFIKHLNRVAGRTYSGAMNETAAVRNRIRKGTRVT
jgi:hypothetical protein